MADAGRYLETPDAKAAREAWARAQNQRLLASKVPK
jgi:hypothetical protein